MSITDAINLAAQILEEQGSYYTITCQFDAADSDDASVCYLFNRLVAIFEAQIEEYFEDQFGAEAGFWYNGLDVVADNTDCMPTVFSMYLQGPFMLGNCSILDRLYSALALEGFPCSVHIQLMDRGTGSLYTACGEVEYVAVSR